MEAMATAVTDWMASHHQGMMVCPHQPGALVLSRAACVRRYMAAQKESYEDMMVVDFFRHRVKRGLLICRSCPLGKRLAFHAGALGPHGPLAEPEHMPARAV